MNYLWTHSSGVLRNRPDIPRNFSLKPKLIQTQNIVCVKVLKWIRLITSNWYTDADNLQLNIYANCVISCLLLSLLKKWNNYFHVLPRSVFNLTVVSSSTYSKCRIKTNMRYCLGTSWFRSSPPYAGFSLPVVGLVMCSAFRSGWWFLTHSPFPFTILNCWTLFLFFGLRIGSKADRDLHLICLLVSHVSKIINIFVLLLYVRCLLSIFIGI